MKQLTIDHIIKMHELLISETGGCDGIRDEALLSSALSNPFQTFDGVYIYPTIEAKAARLAFSLINNHPFVDGNKRIGILAMLTFLEINSIFLSYTDSALISLGLGIAEHSVSFDDIVDWIIAHN